MIKAYALGPARSRGRALRRWPSSTSRAARPAGRDVIRMRGPRVAVAAGAADDGRAGRRRGDRPAGGFGPLARARRDRGEGGDGGGRGRGPRVAATVAVVALTGLAEVRAGPAPAPAPTPKATIVAATPTPVPTAVPTVAKVAKAKTAKRHARKQPARRRPSGHGGLHPACPHRGSDARSHGRSGARREAEAAPSGDRRRRRVRAALTSQGGGPADPATGGYEPAPPCSPRSHLQTKTTFAPPPPSRRPWSGTSPARRCTASATR